MYGHKLFIIIFAFIGMLALSIITIIQKAEAIESKLLYKAKYLERLDLVDNYSVKINGREVTVSGSSNSTRNIDLITRNLKNIDGICKVNNNIKIR